MKKKRSLMFTALIVSALFSTAQTGAAQSTDPTEEFRAIIKTQQEEIDKLKSQSKEVEQKLEMTGEMLDNLGSAKQSVGSSNTTIGGYGELHYNNLSSDGTGDDKKEMDFHRFVLFVGHEFSDKVNFFSEFELEHSIAGEGKAGEIELEQAFIDFTISDTLSAKAGVFLIPVGIINETHEPPTFYGVERNPVEKNIIPATWWEGGAAVSGEISSGLRYDVAITSGLNNSSYSIRSGRQKVGKATAEDLAYTGRLKWTAMPGVEVAGTVQHQANITQGADADASALLSEAHVVVNKGAFGFRALYALWNVDGDGAKAIGADEQSGYYVEPSFRISPKLGVFARYNVWDKAAGDSNDSEYKQTDLGLNYWPHEDVVVKLDYQNQDGPTADGSYDGVNIGLGYQF